MIAYVSMAAQVCTHSLRTSALVTSGISCPISVLSYNLCTSFDHGVRWVSESGLLGFLTTSLTGNLGYARRDRIKSGQILKWEIARLCCSKRTCHLLTTPKFNRQQIIEGKRPFPTNEIPHILYWARCICLTRNTRAQK